MPFPEPSDKPKTNSLELISELVSLWADTLAEKPWAERLEMLNGIHEQLLVDIGDFEAYCDVSPKFVEGLIRSWGIQQIDCSEQAHIYANSGDEEHRQMAGDWLKSQGA